MRGEIDFAASLRSRVATLAGLPESVFATVGRDGRPSPTGVPELIAGVHAPAARSGSSQAVSTRCWIPSPSGSAWTLAGEPARGPGRPAHRWGDGAIVDAEAKAATLREWAADAGIPLSRTVAIGDGANDIPMMAITGLSVGFDAKAPVRDLAGVLIDHRDLSQVLPLLGLRG